MTNGAHFGSTPTHPNIYKQIWDLTGGFCAVDIETISLENREPIGIGFCANNTDAFYFPIDSPLLPWHVLENPNICKLMHNGAFDLGVLAQYLDMHIPNVYDTMIEAMLKGLPMALNALTMMFFGFEMMTIEDLIGKKGVNQLLMTDVPFEKVAEKCADDVLWTYRVWEKLMPNVNWSLFLMEMELQPILIRMEDNGLRLDLAKLEQHQIRLKKNVTFFRELARGMGFNPGSSKQVAAVLESRGWRINYTDKGNPKLSAEDLKSYYRDDPITHLVLQYRTDRSSLSDIEAIYNKHLHGDRIYPRVHQGITDTGRLSRSKPNTQNWMPIMRDILIPSEGNTYEGWDLSQIELRILAYLVALYTNDMTMYDVFQDPLGDIHQATADFMQAAGLPTTRRIAKDVNFAAIYRGTEWTLYQRAGIPVVQGKQFLDTYFATYPGINQLFNLTCQNLRANGYTETLMGRKRYFPDFEKALSGGQSMLWLVRKMEREAFNHRIQGTAGEDLKKLQIRTAWAPQCNTIHDEITFDLEPGMTLNRDASTNLAIYQTPMEVKQGMDWKNMSKIGVYG